MGFAVSSFYGTWAKHLIDLSLGFRWPIILTLRGCLENQSYCVKAFNNQLGQRWWHSVTL